MTEDTGPCPYCGGESDGSCYYSAPLQTKCKDCGKMWGYGPPAITVLEGKAAMRKRPGMFFRFCETVAAMGAWHLHEPKMGTQPNYHGGLNATTLCGLTAAWDTRGEVTLENIMREGERPGHTCPSCREKFVEMTTDGEPGLRHFLCPTCKGEFDRGHKDRSLRRFETIHLEPVPRDAREDFCCVCGALTVPEATFMTEDVSSWCRNVHEEPESVDDDE